MKRILFLFMMFAFSMVITVVASEVTHPDTGSVSASLTTFLGIAALVSFAVTQGAKYVNFLDKTYAKILCSVVIGIVASLVSWLLGFADFLTGLLWWQVIIQGLLAGMSACGLYDILKTFGLVGSK